MRFKFNPERLVRISDWTGREEKRKKRGRSFAAIAEERNASNKVTRRHYAQGVQFVNYNPTTATSYYCLRDHLGSTREMTDSTGVIKARYDCDPWGSRTKASGKLAGRSNFLNSAF